MTCTPAPACMVALAEASDLYPGRSTASDGICSSDYHRQTYGMSDHDDGSAFDVTHDPPGGVDCNILVTLVVMRRDERVKYVIWNQTIWRSYPKPGLPAWTPEVYYGVNPHRRHAHFSLYPQARTSVEPWWMLPNREVEDVPKDKDFVAGCPCYVAGCPGMFSLQYDGGVFDDKGPAHTGQHFRGSYYSLPAQHRNSEFRRFYDIVTVPGQGYYILGTDGSFYGPTLG